MPEKNFSITTPFLGSPAPQAFLASGRNRWTFPLSLRLSSVLLAALLPPLMVWYCLLLYRLSCDRWWPHVASFMVLSRLSQSFSFVSLAFISPILAPVCPWWYVYTSWLLSWLLRPPVASCGSLLVSCLSSGLVCLFSGFNLSG